MPRYLVQRSFPPGLVIPSTPYGANACAAVGLRREDVFIGFVEVPNENWSFGNGQAQYAI